MSLNTTKTENQNENVSLIEGELYSLFVKKEKVMKVHKDKKTFYEKNKVYYRLFISGDMEFENSDLTKIENFLLNAEKDSTLEVRIRSCGGSIFVYNVLNNLFKNKFPGKVKTVINPMARSAAASLFCQGDKRVIYEDSEIMFHDFSTLLGGKSQEIASYFDHAKLQIHKQMEKYLLETKFLTEKEFKEIKLGVDIYLNAKDMCKRNIATHVYYKGKLITAKKYLTKI